MLALFIKTMAIIMSGLMLVLPTLSLIQMKRFLARHTGLKSDGAMMAYKILIRKQMLYAVLYLLLPVASLGGVLLGNLLDNDHFSWFLYPLMMSILILPYAGYLMQFERRLKSMSVASYLQEEFKTVNREWTYKLSGRETRKVRLQDLSGSLSEAETDGRLAISQKGTLSVPQEETPNT